jgi:iron complex outermembrane receptor protein
VKAKIGADFRLSRHASVRLIADNLFDARYAQSSYSPVWIFPGAPRSVKASVEFRY